MEYLIQYPTVYPIECPIESIEYLIRSRLYTVHIYIYIHMPDRMPSRLSLRIPMYDAPCIPYIYPIGVIQQPFAVLIVGECRGLIAPSLLKRRPWARSVDLAPVPRNHEMIERPPFPDTPCQGSSLTTEFPQLVHLNVAGSPEHVGSGWCHYRQVGLCLGLSLNAFFLNNSTPQLNSANLPQSCSGLADLGLPLCHSLHLTNLAVTSFPDASISEVASVLVYTTSY